MKRRKELVDARLIEVIKEIEKSLAETKRNRWYGAGEAHGLYKARDIIWKYFPGLKEKQI